MFARKDNVAERYGGRPEELIRGDGDGDEAAASYQMMKEGSRQCGPLAILRAVEHSIVHYGITSPVSHPLFSLFFFTS